MHYVIYVGYLEDGVFDTSGYWTGSRVSRFKSEALKFDEPVEAMEELMGMDLGDDTQAFVQAS